MPGTSDDHREDAALLEQQLHEALADAQARRGPAFEVALLAGLRERMPGVPAIFTQVEAWIDEDGGSRLAEELPRIQVTRRAEPLLDPTDDESDDERVDALLAFDELCAGFTFCGQASRCEGAARLVAQAVRARSEAWTALSDFAARLLERAPPREDDPAGLVWRAIEAAALLRHATAEEAEVAQLLRIERPRLLAAATGHPRAVTTPLGARARVTFIESDEGAELYVEVDGAPATITVQRDGRPVELSAVRAGTWACPANSGLYVFFIDGTPHPIEIV